MHAVNGHVWCMCLLKSKLPDIICMSLVGTALLLFISHRFRPSQLPDAISSLHCDTRHGNPLPTPPLHTHKQRADKVNQLTALEPLHLCNQVLIALLNLINVLWLNWYWNHQCYEAIFSRSQTVYINVFENTAATLDWLSDWNTVVLFFFLFFFRSGRCRTQCELCLGHELAATLPPHRPAGLDTALAAITDCLLW